MTDFTPDILKAAETQKEVDLTTYGRTSGKPHRVVIWVSTDGARLYIRSGGGLGRHWPQNVLAGRGAVLHLGGQEVRVEARHVTDPTEARAASRLVRAKYGEMVQASAADEPLTPGEQATFELSPAAA